jgi:hypothetical protein
MMTCKGERGPCIAGSRRLFGAEVMFETSDKPLRLTLLVRRRLTPEEMEQLRQAGGDLAVLLKEGLEIKLDKLVGRNG